MRKIILIIIVLASHLCHLHASRIEYPVLGNLFLDEGTIEVWVIPMRNLYSNPQNGNYQTIFSFFSMGLPDDFNFSCSWYSRKSRKGLKVSMRSMITNDGLLTLLGNTPDNWQIGQVHHIAFTWKDKFMTLYADGQKIAGRKQVVPLSGKPGNTKLIFGPTKNDNSDNYILQAIRVSSVAKSPKELMEAKLDADKTTLLFDNFTADSYALSGSETQPQVSSTPLATKGGKVIGPATIITSPHKGLSLSPLKKQSK